jgi:hypothetical protein
MLASPVSCPIPTYFPECDRVVVIGDIHGDIQRLTECLYSAQLINRDFQWIADPPNTIVVQLGDQIDSLSRGASQHWETMPDTSVLQFMNQMDALARAKGGRVISLLGNHELMNVMGDFTYVSPKSLMASGGANGRRQKFSPNGLLARQLAERPVVVKIGGLLFCHAGLLPHHLALAAVGLSGNEKERALKALCQINIWMKRYLLYEPFSPEEAGRMQKVIMDTEGILWNRYYADTANDQNREMALDAVLSALGCHAMFVGHTTVPQIMGLFNRRLWFLDNGLSRAFDMDALQILEIRNNGIPCPANEFLPYRCIAVKK